MKWQIIDSKNYARKVLAMQLNMLMWISQGVQLECPVNSLRRHVTSLQKTFAIHYVLTAYCAAIMSHV